MINLKKIKRRSSRLVMNREVRDVIQNLGDQQFRVADIVDVIHAVPKYKKMAELPINKIRDSINDVLKKDIATGHLVVINDKKPKIYQNPNGTPVPETEESDQ